MQQSNLFSPSAPIPPNPLAQAKRSVMELKPSRVSDFTSTLALTFTLKRLATLLLLPPLLLLIVPISFSLFLRILDFISGGFAWWSMICTVLLYLYWRKLIVTYAPSKEKRTEALNAANKPEFYIRIWIAVLLVFRFIISWVLYKLHLVQNKGHGGNYYSYSTIASFATGIFFLSLLIALRYVGIFAIGKNVTFISLEYTSSFDNDWFS
jgi:hypothetical protein